jgi:hypothetical protein
VTRKRAIACTLGTYSLLRVTHVSGGLQLDLGIQDNKEASARITKKGASFTYDTQFCRAGRTALDPRGRGRNGTPRLY